MGFGVWRSAHNANRLRPRLQRPIERLVDGHRLAADGEPISIEPEGVGVVAHPLQNGVTVFPGRRVRVFGREPVVDIDPRPH